jgi:aminoglycoside phosphotransferase (APT) family kinase protein
VPDPIADDDRLPALAAIHAAGIGAVLADHGLHVVDPAAPVLRHRPGERCTMLVRCRSGTVVVKAYADDPAPVVAVMEALAAAGLADGRAPTVPPLLAYDRELAFTVTPRFAGASMAQLIRADHGRRAGELAAAWLRAAAASGLEMGTAHSSSSLLTGLEQLAALAAHPDAESAARSAQLVSALAEAPPGGRPSILLHGSFAPRHVIELGGGPGVLDLDTVGHGPAEVDAGMMLAGLARISIGRPRAAGAAASAFVDGIADLVDAEALAWYHAAQLVKLVRYMAITRPPRVRERSRRLLDDAARVIAEC